MNDPQCSDTDERGAESAASGRAADDEVADDLVIRASERIPSPVSGPAVVSRPVEIVREETATRTRSLDGTLLDARMSRLPRAGMWLNIHIYMNVMNVMR